MLEVLQFVMKDFIHFIGTLFLIEVLGSAVAECIRAARRPVRTKKAK